jgi:hypothetical protein
MKKMIKEEANNPDKTVLLSYLLLDRRYGIQLLAHEINLFRLSNVQTDSEAQLASYSLDIGDLIG